MQKGRQHSRKKIAEPLERKEIYFMLKALQFKKWLTWCLQYFFSPYDLFIFSINYTKNNEPLERMRCSWSRVSSVIIRWHKKLRWNDKGNGNESEVNKFFVDIAEKCIIVDHREEGNYWALIKVHSLPFRKIDRGVHVMGANWKSRFAKCEIGGNCVWPKTSCHLLTS